MEKASPMQARFPGKEINFIQTQYYKQSKKYKK